MADIDNGVITLVNSVDVGAHNLAVNEVSGFIYAAVGGPMAVADLTAAANPRTVPSTLCDHQVVRCRAKSLTLIRPF